MMLASGFRAVMQTAAQVLIVGPNVILFDTEQYDRLDEYDPLTGTFTVRRSGTYLLSTNLYINTVAPPLIWQFFSIALAGVGFIASSTKYFSAGTVERLSISTIRQLNVGDAVSVVTIIGVGTNMNVGNVQEESNFSAQRLW